jgi:hypothetical protein
VEFAADLRMLREEAGRPPYRDLARIAHYSSTTLSDAAGGKKIPSLAVTLAFVKACGGDVKEWERRWHSLTATARPPEPGQDCAEAPYLGLSSYDRTDANRFFGREDLVADLERRVARHRFVAVFGPSGSGKSSVLRAGLVPRLENPVLLFTPGPHPLEECAVHLARQLNLSAPAVRGQLNEDPEALALLAEQGELVLVVDQFEEIFTLCQDADERELFLTALLNATKSVHVVIGVRADFYARCGSHADLVAAMQDAIVTVGPMTPDELRRAITHPARAVQCTVESALLTTLVTEAHGQVGMLPLLSHALLETWRRRQGNALTLASFENAGGLHGALAQTADAVFDELDEEQRDIAKALFLRLSALGDGTEDTKRRVGMTEIDDDPAVTAVLERLTAARLLTRTRDGVEITHEALIRSWPRLREWLAHDRDGQRLHRELTEATAAWERHGRDAGSLLRGARLDVIADWAWESNPPLNQAEQRFLDESIATNDREYRRGQRTALRQRAFILLQAALAFAAVLLVGSLAFFLFPGPDYRARDIEKSRWAIAEAMRLIDTNPELAAHIAFAGYRLDGSPEARNALSATTAEATRTTTSTAGEKLVALRVGPFVDRAPGISSMAGAIFSDRLQDTSTVAHGKGRLIGGAHASLGEEGTYAATVDRDQVARLWRLSEPGQHVVLPGRFTATAFSLRERLLATEQAGATAVWSLDDWRQPQRIATVPGTRAMFTEYSVFITVDGANIHVWKLDHNLRNPAQLRKVTQPDGEPLAVAHVYGRDYLAAGGRDGKLTLWDIADVDRAPVVVSAHKGAITKMAMNDKGGRLATTGDDGRIVVWDVMAEPKKIAEFAAKSEVTLMAFVDDMLITSSEDGSMRQWRLTAASASAALCRDVKGLRISREEWEYYFAGTHNLTSMCLGEMPVNWP